MPSAWGRHTQPQTSDNPSPVPCAVSLLKSQREQSPSARHCPGTHCGKSAQDGRTRQRARGRTPVVSAERYVPVDVHVHAHRGPAHRRHHPS